MHGFRELDEDDFQATLDALDNEPLWHASLGSKELFHSNMLAWLIERFPAQARTIFAPWLRKDERCSQNRVRREHRHVDLIIEIAGFAPLVIENKMFSLPDGEQLERYASEVIPRLGPRQPDLVLLSLVDPGWTDGEFTLGDHRWRWLSYREIAERIGEQFRPSGGGFPEEFLSRYAKLLVMIQAIADSTSIKRPDEPLMLSPQLQTRLEAIRMGEFVGKLRAHQAARYIKSALAMNGYTDHEVSAGFSNGSPAIQAFIRLPDENQVGWQFQRDQWRLAMILQSLSGRSPADHERRERYALQHGTWFDFGPFSRITGQPNIPPAKAAESRGGFNHYAPDFVYRYRRLVNPCVSELAELAVTCVEAWQKLKLELQPSPN